MDAVVTAGGVPQPNELLYPYTLGKPKALLDIGGKPMVQWVLDALSGAKKVENVVLIGLTEENGVTCTKPITYLPNKISMIENILGGINQVLEIHPSATRVLMVSSDLPAITSEMVDWEIETTLPSDVDLCYTVVMRYVVESRYPSSRRTYVKMKDMEVCGGDLNVLRTSVVSMNPEIWERLVASRKNPIKQAAIIGFDTLFLMAFRLLTMDQAVKKVTTRLKMTGRAVVCPYAEIAMDVDKPNQLEMIRADLVSRAAN
jgi:NDP-sugar pyrophosphorylase family protein